MDFTFLKEKFNENKFKNFIANNFEDIDFLNTDYTKLDNEHIIKYKYLGETFLSDDINDIGFYILEAKDKNIENKRVGFNTIINKLATEHTTDCVIVAIFHPDSDVWRLTFVSYDEEHKLKTNAKRYTYVLGHDISIRTAQDQLTTLVSVPITQATLELAFSVEKVTKEFFDKYKKLYLNLLKELEPSKAIFRNEDNLKLFTKKLLGRIVFLYFLQKKGWLASDENWENGDKKFLSNCFNNKYIEYDNFYADILQPIFFDALNEERENDIFTLLNCKMPFLNGGLFNSDEFDRDKNKRPLILIDNDIFKNIFKVFDSYNFTIIEDSPLDSEIAIDPEMLGRVFEDLLEDRKDKGAFYTPREIVHYMCQQSIKNYLDTKPKEQTQLEYLKQIKILDPAIGSGAFPMGMLHEIVQKRIEFGDKKTLSNLKRDVIKTSIYGIDIEPSAVEIAKLRFWLSIVVDEDKPTPLPNLFYKIMVGNSLVETIGDIDPLEKRQKGSKVESDRVKSIKKLNLLITDYYKEHDNKNQLKQKITDEFEKLFKDISKKYPVDKDDIFIGTTKKDTKAKEIAKIISNLKSNHFSDKIFLYKLFFRDVLENGGFDVIIGNPPYLRVQGIGKPSEQYKKIFDSATGSYDLYVLFTEKALELLSKNGIVNYIMPHKWINAGFGKGLRTLAKDKISKFISFGAYKVFNASTFTSLVWFQNNKMNKHLDYVELDRDITTNQKLEKYLTTLNDDSYTKIKNKNLTSDNWIFTNKITYEILEKIKKQPLFLKDIFKYTSQGIVTTGNDIFYLHGKFQDDKFIGFSKALNKEITLEKGIVKPILLGKDVKRYGNLENKYFVIYPHHLIENKTKPFSEDYLKENYPLTYEYLINFKDELVAKKIKYKNNSNDWFSLTRPREIEIYEQNKLITPQLAVDGYFTYDTNNIYIDAGCYSFIKHKNIKESYKYYMAILNSKVCWFFIKNTSAVFSGGYFYYKPIYLNHFKIPEIDNIEDTKPFEILVDYIMYLKTLNAPINEYVSNKHIIKSFEEVIDAMVFELYFKNDFNSKKIEFIKYAHEDYKPFNENKIETIQNAYDTLSQTKNKIRNNLILIGIEFPDLILPIKKSL